MRMSTVCYLRQIEESQVDALLAEPRKVLIYLFGKVEEPPKHFYDKMLGKQSPVREDIDALFHAPLVEVNIALAWHGIHYLLTGLDWEGEIPLCYLVRGGIDIGDIDVGYGTARVLKKENVRNFAGALAEVEIETLKERYDPKAMAELDIYPRIWNGDTDIGDPLEYLLKHFEKLRAFVKVASEKDKCILIYLC
ncbi:MAG: YfbM family protein [Planctomycetota bacterium]|jgi:hypothetical protein